MVDRLAHRPLFVAEAELARAAVGCISEVTVAKAHLLVVPVLQLTFTSVAVADVITFGDQHIDHLVDAGPQVEGRFTYTATVGLGWEIQPLFGNPPNALATFLNREPSEPGDSVEVTLTSGGLFSFRTVDFRTAGDINSDDVLFSGLRDGILVGSMLIADSSVISRTVNSNLLTGIDLLRVQVVNAGQNAMILDNFNLASAPIPEPTTILLLSAGGVAAIARRRSLRSR